MILDHSKLSPRDREQLFDIIFELQGSHVFIWSKKVSLKIFIIEIKMSSDKVYNKESLSYEQHNSNNLWKEK